MRKNSPLECVLRAPHWSVKDGKCRSWWLCTCTFLFKRVITHIGWNILTFPSLLLIHQKNTMLIGSKNREKEPCYFFFFTNWKTAWNWLTPNTCEGGQHSTTNWSPGLQPLLSSFTTQMDLISTYLDKFKLQVEALFTHLLLSKKPSLDLSNLTE